MLSGIRTGKKKKKRDKVTDGSSGGKKQRASSPPPAKRPPPVSEDNLSVAEALRQQLASGKAASAVFKSEKDNILPFDRLQREGRIQTSGNSFSKDDDDVVVLTGAAAATTSSRQDYCTEDFRHGSRKGKLKRESVDVAGTSPAQAAMSIRDMVQEERRENQQSMDEVFARNVARVGSRYKGTDFKASSATGADEEDAVDMTMFSGQHLSAVAAQQKDKSRQLARHDKERSITSKCWWWMESTAFKKHMLVALGNHVSLVMTPPQLALFPGDHLYLVPVKHGDALTACEDDVWNEIHHFQSSLRAMYAKEGKDVAFCETVMPSNKGLWQTRMECIPIPSRDAGNIPMYFKSALTELADEWGTHTKLLSTKDKGLRRTIPNKFPYFFVEWEPNNGYAQIIEKSSFPKDLGTDTLAGMMQMDPIRFRRKQVQTPSEERKLVLKFLEKWKAYDWTLELD